LFNVTINDIDVTRRVSKAAAGVGVTRLRPRAHQVIKMKQRGPFGKEDLTGIPAFIIQF